MSGTLTHSPSDIVRQLLVNLGVGVLPVNGTITNWPIGCDTEEDSPDNFITVQGTVGRKSGRLSFSGEVVEHHGIQIRIRSQTHPAGWTKARSVAVTIDESIRNEYVTIGGTQYAVHALTRESGPVPLGRETPTSQRRLFTLNATVTLRQLN